MSSFISRNKAYLPSDIRRSLRKVSMILKSFQVSDFVNNDLFRPSVYLLNRNSKMLRPALVLMGAKVAGKKASDFVDLAVATELMHTSSLIHDDMIDGDATRRGVSAVHVKYGDAIALLAGDALLSKAISLASRYGEHTLKSMARVSLDMCAGEILDYRCQKSGRIPSPKEYLLIASLKSASLIGACWSAAAIHSNNRISSKLYASGIDLGMAFQIRDDVMDFIREARSGSSKSVAPNMVSSMQRSRGLSKNEALLKSVQLNNKYIDRSESRLRHSSAYSVFSNYAELIRMSLTLFRI